VLALQFLAAVLLAVVAVQLARRVFVRRDFPFLVRFGQVLAIPGAGIIAYLVQPTNFPYATWFAIAGVSLLFISLGIRIVTGGRAERRSRDFVWASDDLARGRRAALAVRFFEAAGFTTLVFGLEPPFALANIVVNGVWVLLCLPSRLRETTGENVIDIAAPPAAVWRAMTDVSAGVWKTERVIEMEYIPAGRMQLGTKIRSVSRTPLTQPWRGLNEIPIRSESEVIDLVEGSSFTVRTSDKRSWTERKVKAEGRGSVVRMTSRFRVSIADAIVGNALQMDRAMRTYRETAEQQLSRLKGAAEGSA